MTGFGQKCLSSGIIISVIIGVVLAGGCVQQVAESPEAQVNDTQIEQEPAEETKQEAAFEQTGSKLINWTKENGIRTSGVSSSTIVKDNEYWMYYTWNGIGLATSSDGLNFIKREDAVRNGPAGSDQEMATNPTVFRLTDGTYRMIYEGSKWAEDETGKGYLTNRKLYSAISSDGKKWAREDGVRFWDYGDGKPGEIFTSVPDVLGFVSIAKY